MFKWFFVLTFLISSNVHGDTYVHRYASCWIKGTRQDLNSTVAHLPGQVNTTLRMTFSSETEKILILEKGKWSSNLSAPLPARISEKLEAANLTGRVYWYREQSLQPFFNLKITGLYLEDVFSILKYLGADLDESDPWILPERVGGRVYRPGRMGNNIDPIRGYPLNLELGSSGMFEGVWGSRYGYEQVIFQYHLPPEVKAGLSYHLTFECFGLPPMTSIQGEIFDRK